MYSIDRRPAGALSVYGSSSSSVSQLAPPLDLEFDFIFIFTLLCFLYLSIYLSVAKMKQSRCS